MYMLWSYIRGMTHLWTLHVQVDLLKGQKIGKVDVTLQPEELEAIENVVLAKYEHFFY